MAPLHRHLTGHLTRVTLRLHLVLLLVLVPRRRDERGDVPGWVLIVVMSAGIVAVLYGIARTELTQMLRDALNKVK